ncbi:hypothetical protein EY643_05405 [Halioglobus maricola]|uniref:Uncharacterized protein n=1 Tax=Halioglobus maricola TaxID=2601894 RepID=A0A5P9NH31_9GAMM|nr:hypothetical protein [Halioglobus maricola]QFU75130.1 hypothetical protein EY643_05405 [Halioglobus maricola]
MADQEINLRKLLLEGVAIVASILIAFGIDSSWEEFQENKKREHALSALRSEFQATYAGAMSTRDYHKQEQEQLLQLLKLTREGPADLDAEEAIQLVQSAILFTTYLPPTGALDSLIGSGDLNSLLPAELRSNLVQFQKLLESLYRTQSWGLAFVNEELTIYLGERVPLVVFGFSDEQHRKKWSDYYSKEETAVYARELMGSLEFQNLIHTRLLIAALLENKTGLLAEDAGIICEMLGTECSTSEA